MKIFTICLVILFTTPLYAQEKELDNFQEKLNFYIDYLSGNIDSVPQNESNQIKYSKQVDDAFKQFVLHENSSRFDQFSPVKDDERSKQLRLDGRIYIQTKTFLLGGKTYTAFGYDSQDKRNYYIKEDKSNKIVYEGDSKTYLIDELYILDDKHFLLVEQNGDLHSSRSAFVLSGKKNPWSNTKAFEGEAFGQVPGDYLAKKFVKERKELQLNYETAFGHSLPDDVNKISFDPATKTIYYKKYSENNKFITIAAKWENETFVIDDYNVNENLSENTPGFPEY